MLLVEREPEETLDGLFWDVLVMELERGERTAFTGE